MTDTAMNDVAAASILIGGGIVVFVFLLVVIARKMASKDRNAFQRLVLDFGWQDVRPARMLANGIRGTWNHFPVRLEKRARQKSVPEQLILKIDLQSPGRIIITRKFGNQWWNRPFALFGPSVITPLALSQPERFWVRSDEPAFVERLFADARIAQLLEENLIERFDRVVLGPNRLEIRRATDMSRVKKKLGRPTFEWSRDPKYVETVGRAEWQLASAIVGQLALRP